MPDLRLYRRPYLDAQAWIAGLEGGNDYTDDVREILVAADRGELAIVMSVLMPMEVLGGTHDDRTEAEAERALQALQRSSVKHVGINDRVVLAARRLRLEHRLKQADALHLACASAGQADAFLTADEQLLALGSYAGIPIIRPQWHSTIGLFPTETPGS